MKGCHEGSLSLLFGHLTVLHWIMLCWLDLVTNAFLLEKTGGWSSPFVLYAYTSLFFRIVKKGGKFPVFFYVYNSVTISPPVVHNNLYLLKIKNMIL